MDTPSPLTSLKSRCDPDPLSPSITVCAANVNDDDRQIITHFFGRNKKATESIPPSFYHVMCRSHYQEKCYRFTHQPGRLADFQCCCILWTLENIAAHRFLDDQGIEWPVFCGFVLSISARENNGRITFAEPKSGRTARILPKWLENLCTKSPQDLRYSGGDDPDGVAYSTTQMITIVKNIQKWCLENDALLPPVEALPVTIGMHDQLAYKEAKKAVKTALGQKNRNQDYAYSGRQSVIRASAITNDAHGCEDLEEADPGVEHADESLRHAKMDYELTMHTVPTKRSSKPRCSEQSTMLADKGVDGGSVTALDSYSCIKALPPEQVLVDQLAGKRRLVCDGIKEEPRIVPKKARRG